MALNREYTIPSRVDISFPCSHVKPSNTGSVCDNVAPALSSSRPKKRHSQSLNTHSENDRNFPPAKSTWQPQGSRLWKPVGLSVSNKSRNSHISNFQKDTLQSNFTREFTRSSTDSCFSEFSSSSSLKYKQVDSGHITPEDFITPPESPIPRPLSASTCICSDGAISPLDYPYVDSTSVYCLNKHHAFRNRSLSFEDQISSSSSCSGSVASVPNSVKSMPSSPHRQKIQRCRSQPSFYRERKSGKRRKLHGRPNLNLLKMKETAYGNLRSDCFSIQVKDQFCADLDPMMKLMPIASSPLDTDVTAQRMMAVGRSSPIHELEPLNRDSVIDDDDPPSVTSGPIKLIGDDEGCDFMEEEEVEEPEMFAMQEDLDIEQIENH
ncbi:hypothetical protein ACJMK2_005764 [Sinanodonta woodiana]|uniref:Uncharacterized protein n=1 Tax=Sinanodonta woodiana TaxID=1069815 RepID=A0ABD3VR45_SINWO